MEITGYFVDQHTLLASRLHEIRGGLASPYPKPTEFEETRHWPSLPPWANVAGDAEVFAVFYRTIAQIRTKYPFITVYAYQPIGPGWPQATPETPMQPLPREVFQRFPFVTLSPRFIVADHGTFALRQGLDFRAYLFDVDKEDVYSFGGFVTEPPIFRAAFLFAQEPQELKAVADEVRSGENVDVLLDRVMARFAVFFNPNDEPDFTLVTRDEEVVDAFLRNSTFR